MMKAILYQKPNDYRVTQVPIPQLQYPSTVLLKVLAADLPSYTNEVLSGKRHYDLLENSIPGVMAIGEVVSTASNVINFEIGDRVFTDPWVHLNGPDEDDGILIGWTGTGTAQSKAHQSIHRNGSFAEYCIWPAENLTKIPMTLSHIPSVNFIPLGFLSVAHGGLLAGSLQPGQTLVVNGASGNLGGCAVTVALAMGAGKVVALGRNLKALNIVKDLDPRRVTVVQLTGDVQKDSQNILEAAGGQGADLVFDALGEVHTSDATMAAIKSVRVKGTVVLMGGVKADLPINYSYVMLRQITIKGAFMYPKHTPKTLLALIVGGLLDITKIETAVFVGLDHFDRALEGASKVGGGLKSCALIP